MSASRPQKLLAADPQDQVEITVAQNAMISALQSLGSAPTAATVANKNATREDYEATLARLEEKYFPQAQPATEGERFANRKQARNTRPVGESGAPGTIVLWPAAIPVPAGYLLCDGTAIPASEHPALVGILPSGQPEEVRPIAVRDAGYKSPWYPEVTTDIFDPQTFAYYGFASQEVPGSTEIDAFSMVLDEAVTLSQIAVVNVGFAERPYWELRIGSNSGPVVATGEPGATHDIFGIENARWTAVSSNAHSDNFYLRVWHKQSYSTMIGITKVHLRRLEATPGFLYLPLAKNITTSTVVKPIIKT